MDGHTLSMRLHDYDVFTTRYKSGMRVALYTDETQCDNSQNTQWVELMACHFYCALSLVILEIATE